MNKLTKLSQEEKDKIVIADLYKELHICVWVKQIGNKRYCPDGHEEEIDWSTPHRWLVQAYGKDHLPMTLDDVESAARRLYPALRELGNELKKEVKDISHGKVFSRKQFEKFRKQTDPEHDQGFPNQQILPNARTLSGKVTFHKRKIDVLDQQLLANNPKLLAEKVG